MAKITINFDTREFSIVENEPDEKIFYSTEIVENILEINLVTVEDPEESDNGSI
jgi:hypothetical protein